MMKKHHRSGEVAYTDVTTDARVLFDAVRHGKTHLIRFILEASAIDVVNARDLHGKTPLITCCYTKEEGARDKTVKLLLRHGADVNLTDDFGRTVLSYVCEKRCNDILRILVKHHNIDPDISDHSGNSPLIYSAMVGNDIACDILIRHFRRLGLNVDSVNNEGYTALLCAAKHGNVTCAQILIGHGKASIHCRDKRHGLSVEEWLQKKGFTLQDVTPFYEGKGKSKFVKFGTIAAICSGNKKFSQMPKQESRECEYPINALQYEDFRDLEEGYVSDAPMSNEVSMAEFYNPEDEWYQDPDDDARLFPFQKPNMKSKETQTTEDDLKRNNSGLNNRKGQNNEPRKKSDSEKRLSLPDIAGTGKVGAGRGSSARDKKSLIQTLPDVLVATVDLGNGKHKSIKLRSDPGKAIYYWNPCLDEGEDDCLTTIMSDVTLEN